MSDASTSSNQNIDPNIAEVRAALSCWRHGTWSKAYAMEQFEKLLQGFVDRGPVETSGAPQVRAALVEIRDLPEPGYDSSNARIMRQIAAKALSSSEEPT